MKKTSILAAIAIVISIASLVVSCTKTVQTFGGSTSANWNVGGNLEVTGTSALTGATTLGTANVTTGNVTTLNTTGSITIGSTGTSFSKVIATTTAVDFGAVGASNCEQVTTTIFSGGTKHTFGGNELVLLGVDDSLAATTTGGASPFTLFGYIASDDDVGIRLCNASTTAISDPTSVNVRIGVIDL